MGDERETDDRRAARPDAPGTPLNTDGLSAAGNRGKRAPKSGSGAVIGSGASAGGGGGEEDIDADPKGGATRPD